MILAAVHQSYFGRHGTAIEAIAAATQAFGAIVLVIVTIVYARTTRDMAKSSGDAVEKSQELIEVTQKQVEVAQREVSTAQEQVRLQQEANETANQIARESTRARLNSTPPIVSVEAWPERGFQLVGTAANARYIGTLSFDNSQWRVAVDFKVKNHGPGPAQLRLHGAWEGQLIFASFGGSLAHRESIVLAQGEEVTAQWSHRNAGAAWRQWGTGKIEVRMYSYAVVETEVADAHRWYGIPHVVVDSANTVDLERGGFAGQETAAQERSIAEP